MVFRGITVSGQTFHGGCIFRRHVQEPKSAVASIHLVLQILWFKTYTNNRRNFESLQTILSRSFKSVESVRNYISGVKTLHQVLDVKYLSPCDNSVPLNINKYNNNNKKKNKKIYLLYEY